MRYSLKRLLLEQVDPKSLIKNTDKETKLRIARMLADNNFSTDGKVGEDIVALLVGGLNTNKGKDPTVFKDVEVDDLGIGVKGSRRTDKLHSLVAKDNIKGLTADKIQEAGTDRVALVIITASEDSGQLKLTIFGPVERETAFDTAGKLRRPNSIRALEAIFNTSTSAGEMTIDLPSDKNAEAMEKIYDIRRAVSGMDDGEKIAEYLQGVADEIKRIWQK
jgi:hypothetical protein